MSIAAILSMSGDHAQARSCRPLRMGVAGRPGREPQRWRRIPWTEAPRYLIRDRDAIRCYRHAPITSHGHPRQAHCPWLAETELSCREVDRIDPSRMRRPCHRTRRAAFAPSPKILCDLLQQRENAPLIGQRFAGLAPGSAGWPHRMSWSAAFITSTSESNFSVRTGNSVRTGDRPADEELLGLVAVGLVEKGCNGRQKRLT